MALKLLAALYAVYMLSKHAPGAVRFLAPGPERGPRSRFAIDLVAALAALVLLATSVNLLVGDLRASNGK
jgi:hypothetical protein